MHAIYESRAIWNVFQQLQIIICTDLNNQKVSHSFLLQPFFLVDSLLMYQQNIEVL